MVKREWKRPAKITTNAKYIRLVFRALAVKLLKIPVFINLYNYYINGVD